MTTVQIGPETVWRSRVEQDVTLRAERAVMVCRTDSDPDRLDRWASIPETWLRDLFDPEDAPAEISGQMTLGVA